MTTASRASAAPRGRRFNADSLGPWVVAGIVAWAGIAWIGWTLLQSDPPKAGFDLSLLLDGARHVLAGQSPYDPAMLAGASPDAVELFYSYPPPVAQAMTLVSWLPDGVVLVLWAVGATLGFGLVAARLAVNAGRPPIPMAVRAMAIAPLVLPFAIAVLFGNLDAWYPLAYGLLLLAVLAGSSRRTQVAGGVAIAVASIAKLHPAPLLLWVAVRAWRDRGGPYTRVLLTSVVAGLAIVGVSLLIGGVQIWLDYVTVVKAGAGAGLVDPRNIGPVSLIGQATGMDAASLRWIQVGVRRRRRGGDADRRASRARRPVRDGDRRHREPRDAARHLVPLPGRADARGGRPRDRPSAVSQVDRAGHRHRRRRDRGTPVRLGGRRHRGRRGRTCGAT